MKNKINAIKESLKEDIIINRKEYILIMAVCILGSFVLGMLLSPKKELTIGSFNGNGNYGVDDDDEDEDDK